MPDGFPGDSRRDPETPPRDPWGMTARRFPAWSSRRDEHLDTAEITVTWPTPVAGAVVGVVVTRAAAFLPALRAGRVSPTAAVRDGGAAPPA